MPLSLGSVGSALTQHWGLGGLWHKKGRHLPAYIKQIADDLRENGMEESRAIATAISQCKKWAAGGKNVKPETRAKAAAAIAEWERLKASAAHHRSQLYDQDRTRYWMLETERAVAGQESGSGAAGASPVVSHKVKKTSYKAPKSKLKAGQRKTAKKRKSASTASHSAAGKKGYSPSEPRDPLGKWTTGGGSSGKGQKQTGRNQGVKRGSGMVGPPSTQVRSFQELLHKLGYNLGKGGVDGRFGPDTQAAVKDFQRKNGLAQSGTVDHATLSKMRHRVTTATPGSGKSASHGSGSGSSKGGKSASPASATKASASKSGTSKSATKAKPIAGFSGLSQSKEDVRKNGLQWGGKTFHTPDEFKSWLGKRGQTWSQFTKEHPDAAAGLRFRAQDQRRKARPAVAAQKIDQLARSERAMNVGVFGSGRGLGGGGKSGFDPHEPRDPHGRWTVGGGGFFKSHLKGISSAGLHSLIHGKEPSPEAHKLEAPRGSGVTDQAARAEVEHFKHADPEALRAAEKALGKNADVKELAAAATLAHLSHRDPGALRDMARQELAARRLSKSDAADSYLTKEVEDLRYFGGHKDRVQAAALEKLRLGHDLSDEERSAAIEHLSSSKDPMGKKLAKALGGGGGAKKESMISKAEKLVEETIGPAPKDLSVQQRGYLTLEADDLRYRGSDMDRRKAAALEHLRAGLTLSPNDLELVHSVLLERVKDKRHPERAKRAQEILNTLYPDVMLKT